MENNLKPAIELLWNYMQMHQPIKPADALILLGNRDDRGAYYAARLLNDNLAPICVVTGGLVQQRGLPSAVWQEKTEADRFIGILLAQGISSERIYREDMAANTGDNAQLSHKVLANAHIQPKSILIITKPYMERRALATFEMQWPDKTTMMRVSSMAGSFDDYCNDQQPFDTVINTMVGDFARITTYGDRGLSTKQSVPENVQNAFEQLVNAGYDKRLGKI